ncbi:hypothetical protein FWF48_02550 [Candidatus Saccharibacteria bacterium]|nr:hypothetical protein [Candidatus Saccharibacteria bacterium]
MKWWKWLVIGLLALMVVVAIGIVVYFTVIKSHDSAHDSPSTSNNYEPQPDIPPGNLQIVLDNTPGSTTQYQGFIIKTVVDGTTNTSTEVAASAWFNVMQPVTDWINKETKNYVNQGNVVYTITSRTRSIMPVENNF